MPRPNSNYIKNPLWDDSKKVHSREETIISSCREYLSIPIPNQYWTLAGSYISEDRNMEQEHLEMNQLISSGVICQNQYHGVDINREIIENNEKLYPNANWHHGDFLKIMEEFSIKNKFNPSVINYDGVMQKTFGIGYLVKLLRFIDNNVPGQMLLLANFCLNNPYKKSWIVENGETIFNELKLKYGVFPSHWRVKKTYYIYNGSGERSNTFMGTFVFLKDPYEEIKYDEEIRTL